MINMGWLDSPIYDAFGYFGRVLGNFLVFARRYGLVVGIIGLSWSAFRLLNSRVGVKEMFWDTIYKWVIYLLLVALYQPATNAMMSVAHEAARYSSGNAIDRYVANMKKIKEAAKQNAKKAENGDVQAEGMRVEMDSIVDDANEKNEIGGYSFSAENTNQQVNAAMRNAVSKMSEKEKELYAQRSASGADKTFTGRDLDGNKTKDYTDTIFDPDSLQLQDRNGAKTPFLSPSSIVNLGISSGDMVWESCKGVAVKLFASTEWVEDKKKDTEGWNPIGNAVGKAEWTIKETFESTKDWIIGLVCAVFIVVSCVFAAIQYTMTILEFAIIQGIGAFFIPFYLFDGTKDLPKKLVPVFIGLMIKILVITICLQYVMHLWMGYLVERMQPESGGIGVEFIGSLAFVVILSYMLTSNAPKIAQTLLTGQPQLSMGEFVGAAAAGAGTIHTARNAAKMGANMTGLSTAAGAAGAGIKHKMAERNEQKAGQNAAERAKGREQTAKFESTFGDGKKGADGHKLSRQEKQTYKKLKDGYLERHKDERQAAGQAAKSEIKEHQKQEWEQAGGAKGATGRMLAHYKGAFGQTVAHPLQSLTRGADAPYKGRQSGSTYNIEKAVGNALNKKEKPKPPETTGDGQQQNNA